MDNKQYNREYYLRTRERQLARAKKYYQANKAARRAYHKRYYAEHWDQEINRTRAERQRKTVIRNQIALYYGCRNPDCRWQGAFDPCQLDFLHFDHQEKKLELGRIRSLCIATFIAEINKCVVLCKCCRQLFQKYGFSLDESLKCNVDPTTCLPRTPNTGEDDVGIQVTPSYRPTCA
jgi:hypothetical protein